MPKTKKKALPMWRVVRLRGTPATEIGTVEASDAKAAIKEAIKKFDIKDPAQQRRLIAYPGGEGPVWP